MADLITAARTQIGYAAKTLAKGNAKATQEHLDKAEAFLLRAGPHTASLVAQAEEAPVEWSGTFAEAYARFLDAADVVLTERGLPAGRNGAERGAMTRRENIDLATKLGVLDELGGPEFFGPDLGADVHQ